MPGVVVRRRRRQKHAQQADGFVLPGAPHQPPFMPAPWQAWVQLEAPTRQPEQSPLGWQAQQWAGSVLWGSAHVPPGEPA